MGIYDLLTRIGVFFLVLLILTRLMGRKEISQMTFFNFVSAMSIGTIAGSVVISPNISIRTGVIALAGWSVITIALGFIDIKSKKARRLIEGGPTIVIKDGMIMEKALRKTQLDIDALKAMLREKNVFSLTDVAYAIFETDGKLSVMKKEEKQAEIKADMNVTQTQKVTFPIATEVISDGVINQSNLSKLNLDKNWLDKQLQQSGILSISDVFYAEVQKDGTLYIDNRNDNMLH